MCAKALRRNLSLARLPGFICVLVTFNLVSDGFQASYLSAAGVSVNPIAALREFVHGMAGNADLVLTHEISHCVVVRT